MPRLSRAATPLAVLALATGLVVALRFGGGVPVAAPMAPAGTAAATAPSASATAAAVQPMQTGIISEPLRQLA